MKLWMMWSIFGAVSIIGGFFAAANPFSASIAVDLIAGWTFLLVAAGWLVSVFSSDGWSAKLSSLALSILSGWVGTMLLADPLQGVVSLTIVLGISFVIMAVFRLALAVQLRATSLFWPLIASGLLAGLLAYLIFAVIPVASTLALFLAFDLMLSGFAMLSIGQWLRKASHPYA